MYKIKLEEYEFTNNNGIITVKRHDKNWKDYIGDNAVLSLLHKVEELEKELSNCEGLLQEAHDMLDDVHCYDTELYQGITKYLHGDE